MEPLHRFSIVTHKTSSITGYQLLLEFGNVSFAGEDRYEPSIFWGSKKLTLINRDGVLILQVIGQYNELSEYYIDVQTKRMHPYKPRQVTLAEAKDKVATLQSKLPLLRIQHAFYNQHGVGIIGKIEGNSEMSAWWAQPEGQARHMFAPIDDTNTFHVRTYHFVCKGSKEYSINNEPAIRIGGDDA